MALLPELCTGAQLDPSATRQERSWPVGRDPLGQSPSGYLAWPPLFTMYTFTSSTDSSHPWSYAMVLSQASCLSSGLVAIGIPEIMPGTWNPPNPHILSLAASFCSPGSLWIAYLPTGGLLLLKVLLISEGFQ